MSHPDAHAPMDHDQPPAGAPDRDERTEPAAHGRTPLEETTVDERTSRESETRDMSVNDFDPTDPIEPTEPTEPTDPMDAALDRAIAAVSEDLPGDETVARAGIRAWASLQESLAADPQETPMTDGEQRPPLYLTSEEDFHALIPAYLSGELSEAQALLVADRVRTDPAFRAAMARARDGETERAEAPETPAWRRRLPAAMAAAAILAVGASAWLLGRDLLLPDRVLAHVDVVDGALYRVDDAAGVVPVDGGAAIHARERLRTPRDAGAILELDDGSRIELAERSEISLSSRWDGRTIRLERGDVIVQAADQGDGHLYVSTDDALVSVVGTVFSVEHGTKGSRVAVLEGEVHVDSSGETTVLTPGQQVTTSPALDPADLEETIAWSMDREAYAAMLAELRAIGQEIDETVERPDPRTASRLAAVAPEDSSVYVALPNLSSTFSESYTLLRQRVAESERLSAWWAENMDDPEAQAEMDEAVALLGRVGAQLGDEIVLTLRVDLYGDATLPLFLAEVSDPAALRRELDAALAELGADDELPALRWVEDRAAAAQAAEAEAEADPSALYEVRDGEDALLLWTDGNLLAATPDARLLDDFDPSALGATPADDFRAQIAEAYAQGVDWLVAMNLEDVVDQAEEEMELDRDGAAVIRSGLEGARSLLLTAVQRDEGSELAAEIRFEGERAGIAGWLAEPAPMGALDFVSAEAYAATAFVIDRPEEAVSELLGWIESAGTGLGPEAAEDPEAELGAEVLSDLSGALGGEMALAIDGPLLPEPSWKAVVEVYDEGAMQAALERTVARLDETLRTESLDGTSLVRETLGERAMWSLALPGTGVTAHWIYADGFLLMAPSPALLQDALRYRDTGANLPSSPDFLEALPAGAEANFSFVTWQDLGGVLETASELAESALPAEGAPALDELAPSTIYGWAYPDRIRFAGVSATSPVGFEAMLGLGAMPWMPGGGAGAGPGGEIPMPLLPGVEVDVQTETDEGAGR